jgi:hypothetical protein
LFGLYPASPRRRTNSPSAIRNAFQLRCLRYNFCLSATTAPAKNLLAIVSSCLTVPDTSGLAMSMVVHVPVKD